MSSKAGEAVDPGPATTVRSRNRLLFTVAVAVAALFGSASQAYGSFASPTNFGVGERPVSVAVADLDGDGDRDLGVANDATDNVSVLLGNGNGSFAAATGYPAGTRPQSVAISDLNEDGFPDIVVANSGSDEDPGGDVSVLLGNGDGTFGAADNIEAGIAPVSVAVADLNGDGSADLAVANFSSSIVSVLSGNGDGTFGSPVGFATGDPGSGPTSVAIAKLDGDGLPDLAIANSVADDLAILSGNGDGSFGPPTSLLAGDAPGSVAVADLNADRRPDLAVANIESDNISVLLANANGSFRAARNFAAGLGPSSVRIADLNGDRKLDLATADFTSGTVSTLPGRGDGSFGAASSLTAGSGPNALAVGRLDSDAFPDLAVANYFSDDVSVLLNRLAIVKPVSVTGPRSLRKGRFATFRVTVANSGNIRATGVKVVVSGRGIKATSTVGGIGPGAKRTVKVRLRPRKAGQVITSFKVVSGNAGTRTVKRKLRVR